MEANKDTNGNETRRDRLKKRWNTPDLTEFGKVTENTNPRAALGGSE